MPESVERRCLNCGNLLHGRYCATCGQEDVNYRDSLKHLLPEVLHEYAGFDSRVVNSVPALLFKPGFLTNEFNAGRRESYISPLRMYLILSALFFFLVLGNVEYGDRGALKVQTDSASADSTASRALGSHFSVTGDSGKAIWSGSSNTGGRLDTSSWLGRRIRARALEFREHPEEFYAALRDHIPLEAFLLMPLVALLLKILYVRRKRFYIEHLVFSFHVHSYVFLAISAAILLNRVVDFTGWIVAALVLWIMVYIFMALRRVYKQNIVRAIISYLTLGTLYIVMSVVYLVIAFIVVVVV